MVIAVMTMSLPGTAAAAGGGAQAVPLCVTVSAAAKHRGGLKKLVLAQLAHHPSHRVTEEGCLSRLDVELFELEGTFYLTARINREVPIRFALKKIKELEEKLVEGLRRVLGHDPVYLARDVREMSAIQRAAHDVLRRGRNSYCLELFEILMDSGDSVAFASGGGFTVTRGSRHWYIFARVYAGGALGGDPDAGPVLRVAAGGELGLSYEFLSRSLISPYVSAGLGLLVLHFEGRLEKTDRDLLDITDVGGAFSLRAGIRFFRASNFELDVFLAGYLPMFVTNDVDSPLMDTYTPGLQIGLGAGF